MSVLLQNSCTISALCCLSWEFDCTHYSFVDEFQLNFNLSMQKPNDSMHFTLSYRRLFEACLRAHSVVGNDNCGMSWSTGIQTLHNTSTYSTLWFTFATDRTLKNKTHVQVCFKMIYLFISFKVAALQLQKYLPLITNICLLSIAVNNLLL